MTDEFRKGARAMFDHLTYRAANNYHGKPEINARCDEENAIINSWASEALKTVSPEDHMEWCSIVELRQENIQLRADIGKVLKAAETDPYLTADLTNVIDELRADYVPERCSSAQQEKPPANPEVPGTTGADHVHMWSGVGPDAHCIGCLEPRKKQFFWPRCHDCGKPIWFGHVCTQQ